MILIKPKQMAELERMIEEIHQSNLYGCLIEIGAGLPLSNRLFGVSGASNTIYFSLSPYSKKVQEEK